MKLHDVANADDLQAVSERMWDIVQEHEPALKDVMDRVIADERLDRADMVHAGFTFGAAFALGQMMRGNIREINNG